jgi:hypothetical protein
VIRDTGEVLTRFADNSTAAQKFRRCRTEWQFMRHIGRGLRLNSASDLSLACSPIYVPDGTAATRLPKSEPPSTGSYLIRIADRQNLAGLP